MRYEFSDHEWVVIKPMLPNKPRGWPDCSQRRRCLETVAMMRTGSGYSLTSKVHGPQFNPIASAGPKQVAGRRPPDAQSAAE